jgi:hypothetical protein
LNATPKEIIKAKLEEYERAREKSRESYERGQIPVSIHDMHCSNLDPLIETFAYALKILNKYT